MSQKRGNIEVAKLVELVMSSTCQYKNMWIYNATCHSNSKSSMVQWYTILNKALCFLAFSFSHSLSLSSLPLSLTHWWRPQQRLLVFARAVKWWRMPENRKSACPSHTSARLQALFKHPLGSGHSVLWRERWPRSSLCPFQSWMNLNEIWWNLLKTPRKLVKWQHFIKQKLFCNRVNITGAILCTADQSATSNKTILFKQNRASDKLQSIRNKNWIHSDQTMMNSSLTFKKSRTFFSESSKSSTPAKIWDAFFVSYTRKLSGAISSSKHRNKSWYRGRIWKPQAHAVHNWHRITENTIPSDSQYSKQYNITLKKLYCIGWSSHTFKLWIAQVTLCKISLLAIMFKQIWR